MAKAYFDFDPNTKEPSLGLPLSNSCSPELNTAELVKFPLQNKSNIKGICSSALVKDQIQQVTKQTWQQCLTTVYAGEQRS